MAWLNFVGRVLAAATSFYLVAVAVPFTLFVSPRVGGEFLTVWGLFVVLAVTTVIVDEVHTSRTSPDP